MTQNSGIEKIPPCIDKAIKNAFSVQLTSEAKVAHLSMNKSVFDKYSLDCMSTVIMNSSKLTGSLTIGFPKATFLGVLEKMLGEKYDDVTSENADAACEMLNIIFAGARKDMNESGHDFAPAIPSTVVGKGLGLSKANLAGHGIFFECTSDLGPFLVLLALQANAKSQAS